MVRLRPFNVQEYNLVGLISSVLAETNKMAKEGNDDESALRRQMVQAMWSLYSSSAETGDLPERVNVILPTRSGSFSSARNLYFGSEYGKGKLLEYLYGHLDTTAIVCPPDGLGFLETSDDIEGFLSWLGVAANPRYAEKKIENRAFFEYVAGRLDFPAQFQDIFVKNQGELSYSGPYVEKALTVDKLTEVLETSDPHSIITWIAINQDVERWRIDGDVGASFMIWPDCKRYGRELDHQFVPSYTLWLLRTTPWLPTSDGGRLPPERCCLARDAGLSPFVGLPAIDMNHPLLKEYGLDWTAVRSALHTVGVAGDLNELPWDSYYGVLLGLPELDPEGEKAKTVYNKLIGRTDLDTPLSGEKYEEFMADGEMLGRWKGDVQYLPLDKLYYLEDMTIPDNIADQYPILDLEKRKGASKVKKLFGIRQLTLEKTGARIAEFKEHPCSKDFQSQIERLKPYVYALRVVEDTTHRDLAAIKRLEIVLCKTVKASIVVDNEVRMIELEKGHSIIDDSRVYLVEEPRGYHAKLLEDIGISDAVGVILKGIMRVEISNEISRLANCPEDERSLLLDRMAGGSGNERLTMSKELLGKPLEPEEMLPKPPPEEPLAPVGPELEALPEEEEAVEEEPKSGVVGPVEVEDQELTPELPKRSIRKRVRVVPGTSTDISPRTRTNPERAENLSMRFEEAQRRSPEKVSYFEGYEAYGCDIVSFEDSEEKEQFRTSGDTDLISRFIEVKGRKAEKGPITLRGNELVSAQRHHERYYIYRVHEAEDGVFQLIELSNPLSSEKEAMEILYEVNPYRSDRSRSWKVTELKEDDTKD